MNIKPTNRFLLMWHEHHVTVDYPALFIPVSGYMECVFFKMARTAKDECGSLFSEPSLIIKSFLVRTELL
jgi:hypothetical protein